MIIYGVQGLGDENGSFFTSKKEAIQEAKCYGNGDVYVVKYDIGKLDKDCACRLASHRGFAVSQKQVWPKEGELE